MPKCKDFNNQDPNYISSRAKIGVQVTAMESVRLKLLSQYDEYHRIRIFKPADMFNEFRQSFKDPQHSILLIDFRGAEVFITGHLKWVRAVGANLGGVVHVEPDCIAGRYAGLLIVVKQWMS